MFKYTYMHVHKCTVFTKIAETSSKSDCEACYQNLITASYFDDTFRFSFRYKYKLVYNTLKMRYQHRNGLI